MIVPRNRNNQTHTQHTQGEHMANPYELRFRLLEMAQGYLQDRHEESMNSAYQVWDLAKEQDTATPELWESLWPKSYTIEDIKKKATELYEFVEKQ